MPKNLLENDTVTLRMLATGSYVNGFYVEGAATDCDIKAGVQVHQSNESVNQPNGKRARQSIRVFSKTAFEIVVDGQPKSPDQIIWNGNTYDEIKVANWSNYPGLVHWEATAFKIENNAATREI